MPIKEQNAARILYHRLTAQLLEAASLAEGEGVIRRYTSGQELHLTLQHRGETENLVLAFYHPGAAAAEEQACYEVRVNHAAKTAEIETIREEGEGSFLRRLAQLQRYPVESRELTSRSGHAPANALLYQKMLRLFPEMEAAPAGTICQAPGVIGRDLPRPQLHILQHTAHEMTVEIAPLEVEGIDSMIIAMDKRGQTAGVTEISGAFGRYPAYLPYPDGKEMPPAERETYTRTLSTWLDSLQPTPYYIGVKTGAHPVRG